MRTLRTIANRAACILLLIGTWAGAMHAQKFYLDDPLPAEPPPVPVESPKSRKLSDYYDFFSHTFGKTGERHSREKLIPAQAVNTLGDPMDGAWYTRRHYWEPMTIEQLVLGPGGKTPPSETGKWTVVSAKSEGITPGFSILDSKKRRYFVKFDPASNPEMSTAADVIGSRLFHALGYHVPDNYLVEFDMERLELGEDIELADRTGKKRKMTRRDLLEILLKVPRTKDGKYRAVASLAVEGKPIGPFRYYGRRADDPNDIVRHEHRRDLRGLKIFCAWLNHDDSRAVNTLDTVVERNGVKSVRHYLIDFGSILGSASDKVNSARAGHEYLFEVTPALKQVFTLGLYVPNWARARYPDLPAVGRFEAARFDPEVWTPEYLNPAFVNSLPDDDFWAAKQVMAFTDEQIRAIVKAGGYSDPAAAKWVADCLMIRRDKIGKAFLGRVLPLDRFHVKSGKLEFEDLQVKHGIQPPKSYIIQWSRYDNDGGRKTHIRGADGANVPAEIGAGGGLAYYAADISLAGDEKRRVTVYLRANRSEVKVVGVERTW